MRNMTLSNLIERLEEYRDLYGDEIEVRIMSQESWPFENSITGICSTEEMMNHRSPRDREEEEEPISKENFLYLVEGQQICYGSKLAWEVVDG